VFIDRLVQRNASLVRATVELHQRGELPPSTYVIDLDALFENAVALCREAKRLRLSVLAMTKQIGRNPIATQTLERAGVDSFVAVDVACAEAIQRAGGRLGHVGHLVQIPKHDAARIAAMEPDYWTVFSMLKATEAGRAAQSIGRTQAILARVFGRGDVMFESHAGGFGAEEIEGVAAVLSAIDGCRFAGISTYPALAFNREKRVIEPTPNLATVGRLAKALENLGYGRMEVNAPGATSTAVLQMLADAGATQVEPGHGFTGTTPLHAVAELVERPALVYLSEISHFANGSAYCFGGGLYQCVDTIPGPLEALVGRGPDEALSQRAVAHLTEYQTIDFYGRLTVNEDTTVHPGDSVVFCFRPQIFYTRALVAPVSGIASGKPKIEGLFDSQGRSVTRYESSSSSGIDSKLEETNRAL
jgi:predicted amino acid racemase